MATIKFKRGTSKALSEYVNGTDKPLGYFPEEGEPIFETDTGRFKIGRLDANGNPINWNDLRYQDEVLFRFPSFDAFPIPCIKNMMYLDESSGKLWIGNVTNYIPISSGGTIENINEIYGGNASGTT